MPELITVLLYPALIVGLGVLVVLVLWRLGALTPPPVAAWNRVGRNYGMIDDRPLTERLGERAPFLRRFDEATNIPRLLAIAGRSESAAAWGMRNAALALVVLVGLLAADLLGAAAQQRLPFPLIDCLAAAVVTFVIGYLLLRIAARRRQAGLQNALANCLTEIAILTYTRQVSIEQALDLLARAQVDGYLWGLLKDDDWRQLVTLNTPRLIAFRGHPFTSTATVYERIGQQYEVPMFTLLASNMRRIDDKGLSPRSVLTNLARSVGSERLAEMQVRSEQSKFRQAIPIGLMILPLIGLIGYPAWASLSRAFS
jgi:hypothetical protein